MTHGQHRADHTPIRRAVFGGSAAYPRVRVRRTRNTNTFPVKFHRAPCSHDGGEWRDRKNRRRCEQCGHRMGRTIYTVDGPSFIPPISTRYLPWRTWPGEIVGRLQARHPVMRNFRIRLRTPMRLTRPDGPAPAPLGAGTAAPAAQAAVPEPPSLQPGRPSEQRVMPDRAFTPPWEPAKRPDSPPERDTTRFAKVVIDGQVTRRYADPPMHRDPNMLVRSFEGAVRAR